MILSLTSLPVSAYWADIAWNGTVFCAIAGTQSGIDTTVAAISSDGVIWTSSVLPASRKWVGIAWNGTVFCCVSVDSTDVALSTNGITWSLASLPAGVTTTVTIEAFKGLFVTGSYLHSSYYSSDGITWATSNTLPGKYYDDFGVNESVLIAKQGASLYTTVDGINWISQYGYPINGSSFAWNGSLFCATKGVNTDSYLTSPDGITWTERTFPQVRTWIGIAWNGTVFSVISFNSNVALTSTDGLTWTVETLPAVANWTRIIWNGTIFCAITSNMDDRAATSPDGTWQDYEIIPPSLPAFWTNFKGQSEIC